MIEWIISELQLQTNLVCQLSQAHQDSPIIRLGFVFSRTPSIKHLEQIEEGLDIGIPVPPIAVDEIQIKTVFAF